MPMRRGPPTERTIPCVASLAPTGMLRPTVSTMSFVHKILRACTWLALSGALPVAAADPQVPAAKEAPAPSNVLDELTLEGARDMSGEGRAFVETVIDGDAFYLQQPIRVRLRFGVEWTSNSTNSAKPWRIARSAPNNCRQNLHSSTRPCPVSATL